jgi:hypothetical protein
MGAPPPDDAGPFDAEPLRGPVTVRVLVRSAWQDAPPVLRSLARGVWGVAFTGMALLIAVDVAGGWDGLPLVTNLLSQAVSALVALPVALLIVSRLAAYQVEEANRPRLRARVEGSREMLQEELRSLLSYLVKLDEDADAAANELAAAVDVDAGVVPDLEQINRAAWAMHQVMDNSAADLFYRLVGLVRDYGNQLRTALSELRQDGTFTGDTRALTELLGNLEAVVASHRRQMSRSQQLFGRRPALTEYDEPRAHELRTTALTFLTTVMRLQQVCEDLQQYTQQADGTDLTQ